MQEYLMKKNYYKILGLREGCDIKEVSAAYKKLSKKYHPDFHLNNPDATKKFAEITQAYNEIIKENNQPFSSDNYQNKDKYSYPKYSWKDFSYKHSYDFNIFNSPKFMSDNYIYYCNLVAIQIIVNYFPSGLWIILIAFITTNNLMINIFAYIYIFLQLIRFPLSIAQFCIFITTCLIILRMHELHSKHNIQFVVRSMNSFESLTLVFVFFISAIFYSILSVF